MRALLILTAAASTLSACEDGGTSTREMEAAAIDRARQELRLGAEVPLEAIVWAGAEDYDGKTVLCGTVSGKAGAASAPPQRFAATGDPIEWLVFTNAHSPMPPSQPDIFPEWQRICGSAQG